MTRIAATVIGCSAGGLPALHQVLPLLPAQFDAAVVVVSHTAADGSSLLAQLLSRVCRLPVSEAEEREPVRPRHIYIAPQNYHLLIEPDFTFALSVDPRVCNVRPAVDLLFVSAAHAYRQRLAGVVLTGANADGARGLRAIADAGGVCLIQDPATAAAEAMPRAALAAVNTALVLPLPALAEKLIELVTS